ncbi:hypothetical protein [Streptomyces sp. NPDC002599]|uniref:hypothetical protein n=1 Tax=Streptomyces sp. NPDC002599 TaxID=3154421 RepID=UPI00331FB69C
MKVEFFTGLQDLHSVPGRNTQLQSVDGNDRVAEVDWPACAFPGIRVKARWDMREKIKISFKLLTAPLVVGGRVIRHDYDPRVMTRDLVAVDAPINHGEIAVLLTLRELGLLDVHGNAVLPEEALVRNTLERFPEGTSTVAIEVAIVTLLSRGELTRRSGSEDERGCLCYPALPSGRPIDLLVWEPAPRLATKEELRADDARLGLAATAHSVAGHLMRIGHLGKEASPEARDAYREDHLRAGLAGSHELPQGYTYVRAHERCM